MIWCCDIICEVLLPPYLFIIISFGRESPTETRVSFTGGPCLQMKWNSHEEMQVLK